MIFTQFKNSKIFISISKDQSHKILNLVNPILVVGKTLAFSVQTENDDASLIEMTLDIFLSYFIQIPWDWNECNYIFPGGFICD